MLKRLSFHFTDFYHKVTELKSRGIKVLIALGGWNDSLGDKYSRLVNSPSARENFVRTIVKFIEQYNFDGLDLDWEYPKCWQVSVASMEYSVSAVVLQCSTDSYRPSSSYIMSK